VQQRQRDADRRPDDAPRDDGAAASDGAPAGDVSVDASSRAEEIEEEEVRESEQRMSPGADVVHEAIRREGEEELARPWPALAWSGLAAGLSMGFSMAAVGLIEARLPDAEWRPLVARIGYPVGFLIVVLGRQQLFTENTLTPILPLLRHRTLPMLARVARLWALVLAANLIGALIFAEVAAHTAVFDSATRAAFGDAGARAMDGNFGTVLVRGVFAGWLIALMVWILPFAETGRFFAIVAITYVVGIGSFSHVIAGSVDTMYVVATGDASWWDYLASFLAPALLGNIIGGVALVAALNDAQVTAGREQGS
jgi:formate/nitrite transporter FocA (FNT family)